MAFSQATITAGPLFDRDSGAGLVVWWASSSPAGTMFQLYQDRHLVWHGTATIVTLPPASEKADYAVGTVAPDEGDTDFSSSLPAQQGTGDRVELTWLGGLYLEPVGPGSGLSGFRIYSGTTPGGAVNYATPVDDISAYAPGLETDGFGMGGFGQAGFGSAGANYAWRSSRLANGTWHWGVKPYDKAGNEGTASEVAVVISVPPAPPAYNSVHLRLSDTYNASTHVATLTWLASPG